MKQYIVDAFAEELFTGNPAAVLLCKHMPDAELMQKIAIENQYSETAFVVRTGAGHYDLKWFTPGGEIDLCGHATLGAAFVLYNYLDSSAEMHFHTLSGELIVKKDADGFTMDFPLGKTKPISLTEQIQKASSNLALEAYYDGGDMVVIVSDEVALRNFVPNPEWIQTLDGLGLILTAPSDTYDFVSRFSGTDLGKEAGEKQNDRQTDIETRWCSECQSNGRQGISYRKCTVVHGGGDSL